jgi:HSP20 family protein
MLPTLRRRATDVDNPFGIFRRDVDLLSHDFSRMFWGLLPKELGGEGQTAAYPVDISEKDGQILVDAEIPGFSKNEIEVSVENGILKISAERKEEKTSGKKHHLHERHYARVERQLALPCDVDDTKAVTKFENGVLHLTLPKSGESHGRKIKIA